MTRTGILLREIRVLIKENPMELQGLVRPEAHRILFLCAGAREEVCCQGSTRPARRVVEKNIPLLDYKDGWRSLHSATVK